MELIFLRPIISYALIWLISITSSNCEKSPVTPSICFCSCTVPTVHYSTTLKFQIQDKMGCKICNNEECKLRFPEDCSSDVRIKTRCLNRSALVPKILTISTISIIALLFVIELLKGFKFVRSNFEALSQLFSKIQFRIQNLFHQRGYYKDLSNQNLLTRQPLSYYT